jgi:hypothetical protein
MEINLNQECTVTLNKRGVEAIEKFYLDLGLPLLTKHEVGSKYSAPLWEIMNVFGEFTYMGPEPPFETTVTIREEVSFPQIASPPPDKQP